MKIANANQISKALGALVAEAPDITALNLTTEEVEFLRGKPVDAMLFFRDCHREWKKKHVIPESTDTNSEPSFYLGRVTHMSPDFDTLENLEAFISKRDGTYDVLLQDLNLRTHMFSGRQKGDKMNKFKVITTGRLGFSDHVSNDIFMNNDFLEKWSEKHYRGYKLQLCDHWDIVDVYECIPTLLKNGSLHPNLGYVFATKPGNHTSQARFLLTLSVFNGKPMIRCHSYHQPLSMVANIVFRVVPTIPLRRGFVECHDD